MKTTSPDTETREHFKSGMLKEIWDFLLCSPKWFWFCWIVKKMFGNFRTAATDSPSVSSCFQQIIKLLKLRYFKPLQVNDSLNPSDLIFNLCSRPSCVWTCMCLPVHQVNVHNWCTTGSLSELTQFRWWPQHTNVYKSVVLAAPGLSSGENIFLNFTFKAAGLHWFYWFLKQFSQLSIVKKNTVLWCRKKYGICWIT